jgi:hypothetical protein
MRRIRGRAGCRGRSAAKGVALTQIKQADLRLKSSAGQILATFPKLQAPHTCLKCLLPHQSRHHQNAAFSNNKSKIVSSDTWTHYTPDYSTQEEAAG